MSSSAQDIYTQSSAEISSIDDMPLTTVRFEMSSKLMATHLLTIYGRPWIYGAAILIVAAGIIAIFDLRWLFIGLMLLFIAAPLMLFFFYLNYGLRPACVANVLPHTVELLPDALRVSVWARPEKSENTDNDDVPEQADNPALPAVTHIFPLDSLCPYTVGLESVTIPITGKGFIWLPKSAFPTYDGLTNFMQALSKARQA